MGNVLTVLFMIVFFILALGFGYIMLCRFYWSSKFAVYRLVDFSGRGISSIRGMLSRFKTKINNSSSDSKGDSDVDS